MIDLFRNVSDVERAYIAYILEFDFVVPYPDAYILGFNEFSEGFPYSSPLYNTYSYIPPSHHRCQTTPPFREVGRVHEVAHKEDDEDYNSSINF